MPQDSQFVINERFRSIQERLESMADFADASLRVGDYVQELDQLRQMLRAEINRIEILAKAHAPATPATPAMRYRCGCVVETGKFHDDEDHMEGFTCEPNAPAADLDAVMQDEYAKASEFRHIEWDDWELAFTIGWNRALPSPPAGQGRGTPQETE